MSNKSLFIMKGAYKKRNKSKPIFRELMDIEK
jgi:hypothetical protein